MTDSSRSRRKATAQRMGEMIVIRMTGGPDCLWMHMYLDTEKWQMTCDSDVGHYAYRWGAPTKPLETFAEFCLNWLTNEKWLLRKCVDEQHPERKFDIERTVDGLRTICLEYGDLEFDPDRLDDVIDEAYSFSQSADAWSAAIQLVAEMQGVELPEEWYECICMDYTPQQKRFAEICREVIVPELKKLYEDEAKNGDGEKTPTYQAGGSDAGERDRYVQTIPVFDKHGKPTGDYVCIGTPCIERK